MTASVFDHPILSGLLGDEEIGAHFSAAAEHSAMLRFEVALAEAEAAEGVIPGESAEAIAVLPEVVEAAAGRCEVLFDGGIRSGQDVLKALALGAKGTMIGRAYIHGLGAMGEAGVTKALEIIRKELDLTMAFCGRTDINTVDTSILLPGTHPTA